jgi:uncharacterized membrane protein required for colicin V production
MPFNVLDVVLGAVVLGAAAYGWHSGVLRLLVAVSGTMVGFIAARQFYEPVAWVFSLAAGMRQPDIFDSLSYFYVWCLAALAWFWLIRKLYPYTHLTDEEERNAIWALDHTLGLLLGVVLGLLLAAGVVGVTAHLVAYEWPGLLPGGGRTLLQVGLRESALVRWLHEAECSPLTLARYSVPSLGMVAEGHTTP